MRFLILIFALFFSNQVMAEDPFAEVIMPKEEILAITCQDADEFRPTMRSMQGIIDQLYGQVEDVLNQSEIEGLLPIKKDIFRQSQRLRAHLLSVMPQTPAKAAKIDPSHFYRSKTLFQLYLTKMIQLTLEIELQVLIDPKSSDEFQEQKIELAGLLVKAEKTIKTAHAKFRD